MLLGFKNNKKKIIVSSILLLSVGFFYYTNHEYNLAKSHAFEICEMAENIKNKDEIIQNLPSKEEAKRKNGTIIFNKKDNGITVLFVGAIPFNRAICSMYFKGNTLNQSFYETGYE